MSRRRGFPRPEAKAPEPQPAQVDPRMARNYVRQGMASCLATASGLYSQISQLVEAEPPIGMDAMEFMETALRDFAQFHDSIGAALGELAPSHHDRELWEDGAIEVPED